MMKKTFILIGLIILSAMVFSKPYVISEDLTIEGNQIYSSSSCTIIEAKDCNNNPIFWVLSQIAITMLPDATRLVCLNVAGRDNYEICNAIANSVDFLSSFIGTGKRTVKIIKELVEYTVEKKARKGTLYFTTSALDLAYNIKNTVEAYDKLNIVNWESISCENEILEQNMYVGSVIFENVTNRTIFLKVSNDGTDWYRMSISPGQYKKVNFWNEYIKQNYGFCKGDFTCDYQVYTNKTYKLRYSKSTNSFYIEEKQ